MMSHAGMEKDDVISPLEKMAQIEANESKVKFCSANLALDQSQKESLRTLNRLAKVNVAYSVFVKYHVRENVECCKKKNPELVRRADKVLEKLAKMEKAATVHEEAKRKRIHELAILSHVEEPTSPGRPIRSAWFGEQAVVEQDPTPEDFETASTPTRPKGTPARSYIPKTGTITLSEDNFKRNRELLKPFSGAQKQSASSFKRFSGKEDRGFVIMRQRDIKEKLSKLTADELIEELNQHPERASYCDDLFLKHVLPYSVSAEEKPEGSSYQTWYEALKKEAGEASLKRYIYKKNQEQSGQVVRKTQLIDPLPAQAPKRRNSRKTGSVSKRSVASSSSSTGSSGAEGIHSDN
ncbi:hypothetical protein CAEBREN_02646 [Caenorhabditis brenneri]|uniref:Uncharacterized protein n=1 Tax=Caenorhabditis brenneri TaxID=135651 RepID=G0MWJ0_CAEBE|nr:hypothetical protein CAEBREN_02646 [Caenorhabditis brenneri]